MTYKLSVHRDNFPYWQKSIPNISIIVDDPKLPTLRIEFEIKDPSGLLDIFHAGVLCGIENAFKTKNKNVFNDATGIY